MRCADFAELVMDLARERRMEHGEREMEHREREMALRHVSVCPECSQRLLDERELNGMLLALRRDSARLQAPQHVLAELAAALPQPAARRRGLRHWSPALAALAAMVLALAIWPPRRQPAVVPAGSSSQKPPVLAAQVRQVASRTVPAKVPVRRRDSKPLAAKLFFEEGADFLPLDAGVFDGSEEGQIVRVELRRNALVALGLPVDFDSAAGPIRADVLLGNDGRLHAIRFVKQQLH